MANHLRRQIREAIATAVTGLSSTGARVFQSRVYPLETTDLPGLLIYTGNEIVAVTTIHGPAVLDRTLTIRVVGVVRTTADLDDALDQIAKEVEVAVAGMSLAGLAESIALTEIQEPELTGTSEQPTGQITMSFEVNYFTEVNAPDVAL